MREDIRRVLPDATMGNIGIDPPGGAVLILVIGKEHNRPGGDQIRIVLQVPYESLRLGGVGIDEVVVKVILQEERQRVAYVGGMENSAVPGQRFRYRPLLLLIQI